VVFDIGPLRARRLDRSIELGLEAGRPTVDRCCQATPGEAMYRSAGDQPPNVNHSGPTADPFCDAASTRRQAETYRFSSVVLIPKSRPILGINSRQISN
jgi:hypothetical protein